jgi:hypothetical protein
MGMAPLRPLATRIAIGIYVACFAIGTLNHGRDFLARGWRPYAHAPPPIEAFWTALIGLDAAAVALLLLGRRRAGLLLAVGIMTADVAVNTYASLDPRLPMIPAALLGQAVFLGFVLGSVGFLWPTRDAPA